MLSLLSHELRGPLGVIRGYLRLVTQSGEPLSERSREAIAAALRASDRVADVLDQASMLSHLHQGTLKLEPKRVPLTTVLHAAIQAAELPQAYTVALELANLPSASLHADESRLRTAIATLIAAVARAQTSPVTVLVTATRSRLARKPAVRLRIGPKTLSRVDATESELNTTRGGFGLAIPIAGVIITGHRGRVRELKQGERNAGFVVTLPIAGPRKPQETD